MRRWCAACALREADAMASAARDPSAARRRAPPASRRRRAPRRAAGSPATMRPAAAARIGDLAAELRREDARQQRVAHALAEAGQHVEVHLLPGRADQQLDLARRARRGGLERRPRQHGAVDDRHEEHALRVGPLGVRRAPGRRAARRPAPRAARARSPAASPSFASSLPVRSAASSGRQHAGRRGALHDRAREEAPRRGHREERAEAPGPGRLAEDGDARRVAAEGAISRATKRSAASWSWSPKFAPPGTEVEEAERADAVVEGHHDDVAVAGEARAVVERDAARPADERAAVEPHQHRAPAGEAGRQDVRA